MKRGTDGDKSMGPMFPRLHVNDTEKGGPRAPPRNKMALYEQLSIPSQRFNPSPAVNYHNDAVNFVPPSSSSYGQANGNGRGSHISPQLPSAEKACTRYNGSNNSSTQLEQKNKADEDDISVPVFVQSNTGQGNNINRCNNNNNNKNNNNSNINNNNNNNINNGNNNKNSTITNCQKLSPYSPTYSVQKPSRNECTNTNNNILSRSTGDSLQRGYKVDTQAGISRNSPVPMRDVHIENERNLDDANGDDISESSMLDSISVIDISPDDVVGIIGQKQFWKARKAIVNQQRVFAVQVFELHRLMKVQRLIAGSPHLLLEDGSYLGQPVKPVPAIKLPIEYIVKPKIIEQKVISSEKTNQTTEYSAENAVAKASLSSVQNNSQPSSYPPPFSGNPPPSSAGSWGFNQPPGHQWLIPVMSPSEGLVYKPYPGPGFMNTGGGYGPTLPAQPVMGNFMNYGGPPPPHHHYQGLGLPPFTPSPGHSYFPPFGMPVMSPSVEQGHNSKFSAGGSTFNVPYQGSSCNLESQNRDGQGQFSTASSPSERQVVPTPLLTQEAANALSLFPMSRGAQGPDVGDTEEQRAGRLIKVVPHNARSATESVARIFQCIQDERKQFESV